MAFKTQQDYTDALTARLKDAGPLPAGKISKDDLTSQQLSIVGWQPGDPIPNNLSTELKKLRDEAVEELKEASYSDPDVQEMAKKVIAKLGASSLIKIEDLPPTQQRKVKGLLADAKQQQQVAAQVQEAESLLPGFIQGEDREVLLRNTRRQAESRYAIEDDREVATETNSQTEPVAVEAPVPTQTSGTATGVAPAVSNCPCCNWPVNEPWGPEITDVDKMNYLAALLGARRFEKRVKVFGGRVEFVFRTITVAEYKAIMLELSAENRNGVIAGNAEYVAAWQDMRLAMSLESVSLSGNVLFESLPYADWLLSEKGKSAEPEDWMSGPVPIYCQQALQTLTQEPIRLALGEQFGKFEALTESLQKKASAENFW